MQIRPVIATLLQDIADPVFVITGHSLGGATAIIAAVSLLDLVSNPVIYTFGGPRVGNLAFVNHVQSQKELTLFRVVHNHDVVVHVPPCTWSLSSSTCDGEGYPRHIPVEVLYNHDMTRYKVCNMQDGEDITCAASFSRISYSIREHLTYFDVNFNNQKAILLPDANQFSTL
uniref:Fungal lipase-type domain-containing protein n=1 Tax=Spongospora subterranea TaxID=70186 RepID=A0A0H5R9I3_9EUKA|eukprot:CRZ10337.1 hypothetical protein [Spongospora subterranea]